ncbi:MAG: cbb3-type cytochrome oxidase assembly protein CcoS [SAR324 cluster bacterium]|nr:cbb3-type cytochrome oxidase assembly protein CcoS [SAR324 cluster bacterium]MBL7034793.1 cbb3-type cytochrome oxidase assembly protein CcoS [SAR324 cluster bacterium]
MDILPLLIGISLFLGLIGLLGFLWGVRHGMFDDPEGTRYRILLDDQEEENYQEMLEDRESKSI